MPVDSIKKLKLYGRTLGWVQHPMSSNRSMPFLQPNLTKNTKEPATLSALTENELKILVGEGGSGKSTIARQLTQCCSQNLGPFHNRQSYAPVFLRLKPECAELESIFDLAKYCSHEFKDLQISAEEFNGLLNTQRLFLVLDGLDEIFNTTSRDKFFHFTTSNLAHKNVLLTSRPNELVLNQPHYTIDNIPLEVLRRYIQDKYERLHNVHAAAMTDDFFTAATNTPWILPLLNNPLLLEQATILFSANSSFGKNIYKLIETMVDALADQLPRIISEDHFKSATQISQYGFLLLDKDGKMGEDGFLVRNVIYAAASRLIQLGSRSMNFDEYVNIIKQNFETEEMGLNEDEVKLATRAFLEFCPAFCEYEHNQFGFIHLSLQDNIGVIAAINDNTNVIEGYKQFIEPRDLATQIRFFDCLIQTSRNPVEILCKFVMTGTINQTNVQGFRKVVNENKISLPKEITEELEKMAKD